MIRLTKGNPPSWLSANAAARTHAYIAAASNNKPSPWNTDPVKTALAEECHRKCMYCEAMPADSSYLAVEHIKPKSRFPDLVLEWSNLGWACTRCNTHKGDYWSENPALTLLNPYSEDPANHLTHAGPMVLTKDGSSRGANTIRQCRLNRPDLIVSKARQIEALERVLQMWESEEDEDIQEVLAEDVAALLEVDEEFTASLRVFAEARGFDVSRCG